MLVAQYQHAANTSPSLNVRNASADWPLEVAPGVGPNGSGTPSWGHTGQAAAAAIPDPSGELELRWYAETSAHNRTIHFRSPVLGEFQSNSEPGFYHGGIATNFTPLSGHTANLPASATNGQQDRGNGAITNSPFFRGSNERWSVGGSRWEVDDGARATADTFHQVWVRNQTAAAAPPGSWDPCATGSNSWSTQFGPGDWEAWHFANRDLSGSPATIVADPDIDENWGGGSNPLAGNRSDDFSVRWYQWIYVADDCTIQIRHGGDDGYALQVDGTFVINRWFDQAFAQTTTTLTLTRGYHDVYAYFYERGGQARTLLEWRLL